MTAVLPDVLPMETTEPGIGCTLRRVQPDRTIGPECGVTATWYGLTKCCANIKYFCEPHHDGILQARVGAFNCRTCGKRYEDEWTAFAVLERL